MFEQQVIISSLGEEEMELQMFTIVGASKKATLLTSADAAQLRALQETDLRYIRVGYDSDGNWLTIDLGNGELFFCNDEYRPSDVIRTPIETVMNWAPTTERLLLLTQSLKRGELSEQELPRKRYTPTFEEMIKWVLYVKEGLVTREDVSDWAGRVLQQSDDDLIVGMTTDSLVWLNGIDLPDGDSGYLHDKSDLDEWVLQLERKIDEL